MDAALVGLAGCDKSLPGMMMAMVRLNLPSVFMYGGSATPGRWKGKDVTVLDTFEAVGAVIDESMQNRVDVCVLGASDMGGRVTARRPAPLPQHRTRPMTPAGRRRLLPSDFLPYEPRMTATT